MKETSTVVASREPAPAAWTTLAETPVWFGHQSVGRNIIAGLRDLGAGTSHPLTIVQSRAAGGAAPALHEFAIGENGKPESKIADFTAAIDALGDSARGVALFEYCFLDITPSTDVQALFERHRDAMRALRARHPQLTIVTMTAALTADEPMPRYLAKRLLGRPTTRQANAKRGAFNALLRREYAGEPIFDIARVESTAPDGSRSYFTSGADTVHTLAPANTDDGGHLNETGRRAAAAELVEVLAGAARATPAVARSAAP